MEFFKYSYTGVNSSPRKSCQYSSFVVLRRLFEIERSTSLRRRVRVESTSQCHVVTVTLVRRDQSFLGHEVFPLTAEFLVDLSNV